MDTENAHWAILELMGHRRLGGLVQEVERYGAKMARIDIPDPEDAKKMKATQFYGGSAIFCETPCTEEAALAVARISQAAPVQSWELPVKVLPPVPQTDDDGEYDPRDGAA